MAGNWFHMETVMNLTKCIRIYMQNIQHWSITETLNVNAQFQISRTMFHKVNELEVEIRSWMIGLHHPVHSLDLSPFDYHFCKHFDNWLHGRSTITKQLPTALSWNSQIPQNTRILKCWNRINICFQMAITFPNNLQ